MLVGRDSERHRIARLVSGARVGESSALVLTGEAGIGKTSLLEQAVELAEGMTVLRAAGSVTERDVPFAGLHQLLLPVAPTIDGLGTPHASVLHVALGLRPGGGGDRFAVGAACLALLTRLAERRAVLLVVDDVHLWDRASVEALAFVGRRLLADQIGLLAASRDTDGSPALDGALPQLRLGGLSLESVTHLLSRRGPPLVDEELARRVHAATAGNPLAVVELAGLPGTLLASPQAQLPVPEVLTEVFGRRAGELPAVSRVATLVAALGEGDLALVERALDELDRHGSTGDSDAAGAGATVADLLAAESAGLVVLTPGRVDFRHPLTRASVYAAAPPALRRAAHLAVARALPDADRERRTWHRCEAAAGPDDAVALALEELSRGALERGAPAVAATALEKAAWLSTDGSDRAVRFLAAGRAAWLAGQGTRADGLLGRADGPAAPDGLREQVQGLRGTIALRAGSLEQARDLLVGAADAVQGADPDAATLALADAVSACFYLADARGGLAVADRLEVLYPRCVETENRVRGRLGVGIARVLAGRGGTDDIRAAVDHLATGPEPGDDQVRPAWTVVGPLFLRESDTGVSLVRHAVEGSRERRALMTLPNLLFHTARHDATSDRWRDAAAAYAEGVALARETGQTTDLTMCLAGLAWLEARTGRATDCRGHAEEALTLARRDHVHLGRLWATFALGDLELGAGRAEAALTHYDALHDLLVEHGVLDVDLSPGPERTEALLHLGRGPEARAIALEHDVRAREKSQPWALARAHRALALTATGAETDTGFARALGYHAGSPDSFELARTRLCLGEVLRRGRRRVEARGPLREALGTFERLGAAPWADVAAVELAATGETARRQDAVGLDRLTAQERQIAQMLAGGRTTRETAAALFLSPKTVEYHLRHVYTKLDLSSRAELSAALAD